MNNYSKLWHFFSGKPYKTNRSISESALQYGNVSYTSYNLCSLPTISHLNPPLQSPTFTVSMITTLHRVLEESHYQGCHSSRLCNVLLSRGSHTLPFAFVSSIFHSPQLSYCTNKAIAPIHCLRRWGWKGWDSHPTSSLYTRSRRCTTAPWRNSVEEASVWRDHLRSTLLFNTLLPLALQ